MCRSHRITSAKVTTYSTYFDLFLQFLKLLLVILLETEATYNQMPRGNVFYLYFLDLRVLAFNVNKFYMQLVYNYSKLLFMSLRHATFCYCMDVNAIQVF